MKKGRCGTMTHDYKRLPRSDQIADHDQPGGDADARLKRSAGLQSTTALINSSPARTARSASSS
jgi:hypothetical protein